MKENKYIKSIIIFFIIFAVGFPILLHRIYRPPYADWYNILASFVGGAIGGITTLIALYVSTNETRKIQTSAIELENKREKDRIKENALIVYYDLSLGLKDIKKLFLTKAIYGFSDMEPKRMYFNRDWIQNTAIISNDIRINGMVNDIYTLYGDLLTIKDFLEVEANTTKSQGDLIIGIDRIGRKILKEDIYNRFNINVGNIDSKDSEYARKLINKDVDAKEFLKKDYIDLLEKIKSIAYDN